MAVNQIINDGCMTSGTLKNILKSYLSFSSGVSKSVTANLPAPLRLLLRGPILLVLVLLVLAASPVLLSLRLFKKPSAEPFASLRGNLEPKWNDGSREEAITELRKLKTTIIENEHQLFTTGVPINPYGTFYFNDLVHLLWMLYYWEIQSANYGQASETCDWILEKSIPENPNEKPLNHLQQDWILNKAGAILHTNGAQAAREYLLQFIGPENEESRIKEYINKFSDQR